MTTIRTMILVGKIHTSRRFKVADPILEFISVNFLNRIVFCFSAFVSAPGRINGSPM